MTARTLLEAVAIGCIAAVVYSYLLYPLLLFIVAALAQALRDARYVVAKADRRNPVDLEPPSVAVVISAFNEERHLRQRITNLFALDYPPERLRVYIGSDGSRDTTADILRAQQDARLRTFVFDANRGKASVLNDLVAASSEAILVFTDANTLFHRDALRRLVAPFADPRVGGVSGELRLAAGAGNNQDSLYWRVEQFLKFFEARLGALLGANGAIYAIRREHWRVLRPDTLCDDFCVAMNVAAQRRRLVYEPAAWAEEDTPPGLGDEVRRRVRIGIGNFQALLRHPEYLTRTSAATAFAYLSHKVLRWIAPHLLLVGLAASAILGIESTAWLAFAAAQAAFYTGAALLYRLSERGVSLPGALRIPAFLFALNWAFLVASMRYAGGQSGGAWSRTSR